ncbi:MAG: hypothetical protein LBM68_04800 [Bacteroidales bacterium]|jgi:hypothetical protein|nr:hypothetical protein [Bacteroidales bacterium]
MTPDTCKKFWAGEKIEIASKHEEILLCLCDCDEKSLTKGGSKGEEYIVDGENLITLKTYLINYLNLLEVIFTAWNTNVGDRQMIEAEFGRNVVTDNGEYPLDNIINQTTFFPSIKAYVSHKKNENTEKGKKKLS